MPSQRTQPRSPASSDLGSSRRPSMTRSDASPLYPESSSRPQTALSRRDRSNQQREMEEHTHEPNSSPYIPGSVYQGMTAPLHPSTPSSLASMQMSEMYRALPHTAMTPGTVSYSTAMPIYGQLVPSDLSAFALRQAQLQTFQPHYAPAYASRYGMYQPIGRGGQHAHPQQDQASHRFYASRRQADRYNRRSNADGVSRWPDQPVMGGPMQYPHANATPSCSRGPPRKPKQSGHALWVGNLPTYTQIVELKDHFSKDATNDIESVFLISKSNCAFVNYRTEESCVAAVKRFHESRFHSMRLVCRLRKGNDTPEAASAVASSSSPPSSAQHDTVTPNGESHSPAGELQDGKQTSTSDAVCDGDTTHSSESDAKRPTLERTPERYFIVKSLTVEDLEASVRDGLWATQSHNERTLNEAFESSDIVYLIFSVNKSGEYFGYAKMQSGIDKSTTNSSTPARATTPQASDGPTLRVTPGTQYAPKGRIIDDSARGTIFWEADPMEMTDGEGSSVTSQDASKPANAGSEWGRPFRIMWISTDKLPFHRTRGLRNPWNSNREVKIARDGIELEPGVGRRLVQMFHHSRGMAHYGQQQQQQHASMYTSPQAPPPQMYQYQPQYQHQHFQPPPSQLHYQHTQQSQPQPRPQPQYTHQPVIAKSPHTTRLQPRRQSNES